MNEAESLTLYEVGYLISPLVPETEVGEAVEQIIRAPIGVRGGQVTGELVPVLRRLAYRVASRLAAKKSYFLDAYFGAVRFEAGPETVAEIKLAWEKRDELLRYVLIALPKGSEKTINLRRFNPISPRPLAAQPSVAETVENPSRAPMTTAEIDKEIAGLLDDHEKEKLETSDEAVEIKDAN